MTDYRDYTDHVAKLEGVAESEALLVAPADRPAYEDAMQRFRDFTERCVEHVARTGDASVFGLLITEEARLLVLHGPAAFCEHQDRLADAQTRQELDLELDVMGSRIELEKWRRGAPDHEGHTP